jgi:uncharacterized protein YecT (DUF1311 family)
MRILFTFIFFITLSSFAWADANCKKPDARYKDIGCAVEVFENADKALNEAYKALSMKMDQEGKEKLKEAQRAWILFRNADTALAYQNSGEGGSLGGLIATNHKVDLTLERTNELKELLKTSGM